MSRWIWFLEFFWGFVLDFWGVFFWIFYTCTCTCVCVCVCLPHLYSTAHERVWIRTVSGFPAAGGHQHGDVLQPHHSGDGPKGHSSLPPHRPPALPHHRSHQRGGHCGRDLPHRPLRETQAGDGQLDRCHRGVGCSGDGFPSHGSRRATCQCWEPARSSRAAVPSRGGGLTCLDCLRGGCGYCSAPTDVVGRLHPTRLE